MLGVRIRRGSCAQPIKSEIRAFLNHENVTAARNHRSRLCYAACSPIRMHHETPEKPSRRHLDPPTQMAAPSRAAPHGMSRHRFNEQTEMGSSFLDVSIRFRVFRGSSRLVAALAWFITDSMRAKVPLHLDRHSRPSASFAGNYVLREPPSHEGSHPWSRQVPVVRIIRGSNLAVLRGSRERSNAADLVWRHRPPYGSAASRRPSPTKLKHSTVAATNTTGTSSHG